MGNIGFMDPKPPSSCWYMSWPWPQLIAQNRSPKVVGLNPPLINLLWRKCYNNILKLRMSRVWGHSPRDLGAKYATRSQRFKTIHNISIVNGVLHSINKLLYLNIYIFKFQNFRWCAKQIPRKITF